MRVVQSTGPRRRPVLRRRYRPDSRRGAGKSPSVNLAIAALIAAYTAAKKVVEQSAERAAISEVISAE
jgi:hypothetical protein